MKYRVTIRRTATHEAVIEVEGFSHADAARKAHAEITAGMKHFEFKSYTDTPVVIAAVGPCEECNGRRWFRGMEGEDIPCSRCNA